jgi:uncharacterized membrane protein
VRPSRTAALFFVLGAGLVPWTLLLADRLPSRKIAHHWDLAWVGLDVALAVILVATGFAVLRQSPARRSLAAAAGTLVLADAWFDVVTASTTDERWLAVTLAVLVEIPLAVLCFVLARPEPTG